MEHITIDYLLKKYKEWVETGQVQFLKKGSKDQKEVLGLITDLHTTIQRAIKKGPLSENLNWREAHMQGEKLWKSLASYSLHDIDSQSKGNSELFRFLDASTKFEDLLYGLEPYYRDHTLHSLWVYFIGEYILREHLPDIHNDLNWYLYNDIEHDIEREESLYSSSLLKDAREREKGLCKGANEKRDAIWCIIALCHDLGYSLSKLNKLNEKVQEVLEFLDLPDFRHIGYSLDIEHQYIVSQFLELMAMDVRIVPSENKKEVLVKCYRDDSAYWPLCRTLEKKHHGILSAYLIYRILGIFADTSVRGPAEEWGLDDDEAIENMTRGGILFAIAQHTFDFAYLYQLSSLADILILADELEEFSRYGREMLSRKYHDTTAEARISFKPSKPKQGDDIEIYITYEVVKHLKSRDFYEFFIRKAEQVCRIYSLGQGQGRKKFCAIKSIKMTAEKEEKAFSFHLCRDPSKTNGYLPETRIKDKKYEMGTYLMTCYDDKIKVNTEDGEFFLDVWFKEQNVVG